MGTHTSMFKFEKSHKSYWAMYQANIKAQPYASLESGVKCFISFYQMKLLNTAPDMDNFSVVITTVGLSCHHEDLFIYGYQNTRETDGGNIDLHQRNLHFVGTFSKFELVEAEVINGFNKCVFKPVVNGFSPYAFVSLKGIPETENWKICEVEFA